MNRFLRSCTPVLFVMVSVAAGAQPPSGAMAPAGQGMPGGEHRPAYKPKNLKVLPEDTDLRVVMRQYSGDLGVGCEFCHAAPDPVTHRSDKASDANPMKNVARFMIQMTADLNTKYLGQMPNREFNEPITCGTCHRGETHPSVFVPSARPEEHRQGAGGPPMGAPPAQ